MAIDYRAQAHTFAGLGNEAAVNAVVRDLHYNESMQHHDLGEEHRHHGACAYCWLRAGRAVRTLSMAGLLKSSPTEPAPELCMNYSKPGHTPDQAPAFSNSDVSRWPLCPPCRKAADARPLPEGSIL